MSPRQQLIFQHTRLQRLNLVPEICLHLADELTPIWRKVEEELGEPVGPPPFWAFAWVGGQAIARYLLDHPREVAGKRVLDIATGSGLCAIAAMKAGAACALAADIDTFCEDAVALNAQANRVSVAFACRDLLGTAPPDIDLILAGDICYQRHLAERALVWLRAARSNGARVLIGDPGRPDFPQEALIRLAEYQVATTREVEDSEVKLTGVFTFPGGV